MADVTACACLSADEVRSIVRALQERCEMIRAAGGVSLMDVVDGRASVPDGFLLDMRTDYYVPPNLFEPFRVIQ